MGYDLYIYIYIYVVRRQRAKFTAHGYVLVNSTSCPSHNKTTFHFVALHKLF